MENLQPNPANFVHEHVIHWVEFGVNGPEDCNHSTLDCPTCGELLLVVDGYVVNFHPWMNSQNPAWPADGEGTSYLEG